MDSNQQSQNTTDYSTMSQIPLENGHVMKTFTGLMNDIKSVNDRNTAENYSKIHTQETSFDTNFDGLDSVTLNHDLSDVITTKQKCEKDDTVDNPDEKDHEPGDSETVEEQFMTTIENGNVKEFMDMINQKEELNLNIEYVNSNGQTPMRLAIESGYAGKYLHLSFFLMSWT